MLALTAACDDLECARYIRAYEAGTLNNPSSVETSAADYARMEQSFFDLTASAVSILAEGHDIEGLRSKLPSSMTDRLFARGTILSPEPDSVPIDHLVPSVPFALADAVIGTRSHVLMIAYAARLSGVPLVITGPIYDVNYLLTLRTVAPDAIVLPDAAPSVVSALYRRASIWVDAAPRPRTAAGLVRAVACGALPVVAAESPLARIVGYGVPAFPVVSADSCAQAMARAISLADRDRLVAALQVRLAERFDPNRTFATLMTAYARTTLVS
jgi:hypothetical protein